VRESKDEKDKDARNDDGESKDKKIKDAADKLAEIVVGLEPRCVAVHPNNKEAYVTNGVSGTVSVLSLTEFRVVAEIPVGTEPRGCALTPNGTLLYVANHTEGTVSIIETESWKVVTMRLGRNPTAIAITNDGDKHDKDEHVFVTQIFAELIPNGPGEGRDLGKQGVVHTFPVDNPSKITKITLSPLSNSGFTSDRTNFCPQFNANVQALVHVVDTEDRKEEVDEHVNLNVEIATEPAPKDPTTSLAGLFGNDLVAIDADPDGKVFLIVSRGGNYVLRATLGKDDKLTLGAPKIVRFQTGNLPNGIVVSRNGKRAYANNEANVSVTAIDLENSTVIERDIPSGEPAAPGTFEHAVLVGKVAFFTALGIPDNGIFGIPIREFNPLADRGKMSKDAWSSCGSCHPDGLADGVTWFFGTGPRQTIPLDGTFAKDNPDDQRLLNWSAVRGSNTDFNNNSRATQGGCGFASDAFAANPDDCLALRNLTPANPAIYDHGITQGASDALDAQTLWIFAAVRPLKQPPPSSMAAFERGLDVFAANCASCHGGAKWSKSQIFHRDNPAAVGQGLAPLDPGVVNRANEFRSFTCNDLTFNYLEDVGTFDVNEVLEIRDITGITALGADGFNPSSLLSINYHAPYLHRGQAQTLEDVFLLHRLPAVENKFIADALSAAEQKDLLVFLKAIDGTTDQLRSAGDDFRDGLRLQTPPCPTPPMQ
jgi:YVTN family beta-propeller protein